MTGTKDTEPFYIEADCCLSCGMPEFIAPELFHLGEDHCVILRQPRNEGEFTKAIVAMWSSEAYCIRYRGNDEAFLMRLGKAGLAYLADNEIASQYALVLRDRVVFRAPVGSDSVRMAEAFRASLRSETDTHGKPRYRFRPTPLGSVAFAWYADNFHSVSFEGPIGNGSLQARVRSHDPGPLQCVSRHLDGWLRKELGCTEIAWFDARELHAGESGFPFPY